LEEPAPFGRTSHGEVAQMEDDVIFTNDPVPIGNQCIVHFLYTGKRTLAILDDIAMSEVSV
jgi:hypothetical protein